MIGLAVLLLAGPVLAGPVLAGPVLAAAAPEEWHGLGTFDGATVETQPAPGGVTRVRASRVLPVACERVVAVLSDVPHFSRWITLSSWTVVDASGPVMHGRHDMPFPFAARDYVVAYTSSQQGDTYTLTSASTDRGPKAANGVVRLHVLSTWTATPVKDSCAVSYTYNGDLGGGFPSFLLEGVWKDEGPKLLAGLLAEARK